MLLRKVKQYCDDVLEGRIPVSKHVKQAVINFKNPSDKFYFDYKEAEFALRFIECLKHSKGSWANANFILEPWQAFIVANIFGWKRHSDNTRRYRTAFVSVARKNGKSTLAAAIGLKLFVADNEYGAEIYTAATKRDQARLVHAEATRMVKKCSLKYRIKIRRDDLIDTETDSIYQPLGADVDGLDGLNVHGAIIDEVHAHKTRKLWDVIDTATGARKQPLLLCITTAGDIRECIYSELKEYSLKTLYNPSYDDSWFTYIATLDNDEEVFQPEMWIKANPNLGVSITQDYLESQYKKAKEKPIGLLNFKRRHLNVDTVDFEVWEGAQYFYDNENWYNGKGFWDIIVNYKGLDCYVGADFSSIVDLTSVVLVFQKEDGFHIIPYAWVPKNTAYEGYSKDDIPYFDWHEQGVVSITNQPAIDYEEIRQFLHKLRSIVNIKEIAADPHNARFFLRQLELDNFNIFEHKQSFVALNDPIKTLHRLLLTGKIRHGNNPLLLWSSNNVKLIHDSTGNVKFDKRNDNAKIDVMIACVMAVYRATIPEIKTEKVYEKRGILFI